jgi:hypothetical protein
MAGLGQGSPAISAGQSVEWREAGRVEGRTGVQTIIRSENIGNT